MGTRIKLHWNENNSLTVHCTFSTVDYSINLVGIEDKHRSRDCGEMSKSKMSAKKMSIEKMSKMLNHPAGRFNRCIMHNMWPPHFHGTYLLDDSYFLTVLSIF